MGRPAPIALGIAILCALTSCVSWQADRLPQGWERFPRRVELTAVPFYPQDDHHCGPAALATVLSWTGDPLDPEDLELQTYTPVRRGSFQAELVTAARRRGRLAYPVEGIESLLTELTAGNPVIVLQNLGLSWYPAWHYAVAVGFDLAVGRIILRSGRDPRKVMHFRVFERTWARSGSWGLVLLEPGELPATAEEVRYLEAAVGLERARQWHAAARAYEAALERWEGSLVALMGLGNSRHADRDLPGAEKAFRRATQRYPDAAAAFNNLAQVLAEEGRLPAALTAAERAVALGGPHAAAFAETLEKIRAQVR